MNEIHIPYKASKAAKWRLGKPIEKENTELIVTPSVAEQCPASYAFNENMNVFHVLPTEYSGKHVLAIKETNATSIGVKYFSNLQMDSGNIDMGAKTLVTSQNIAVNAEQNLLELTIPDQAEFFELELESPVEFYGKEATGNDFVARYEHPSTISFSPNVTLLLDYQESESSAIEVDVGAQNRIVTRLETSTYPIYGIRLECPDRAGFARQVKNGISICKRSITGQVNTMVKHFTYTSDAKQPIVEMHFDTPLMLGQTTGLEIDLVEGEGILSLQLEPTNAPIQEAEVEVENELPVFVAPEILHEKKIPTQTILLGGLLLIAAIVLTAE